MRHSGRGLLVEIRVGVGAAVVTSSDAHRLLLERGRADMHGGVANATVHSGLHVCVVKRVAVSAKLLFD